MRYGLLALLATVVASAGAAPASGSWGAGEDLIPAGSQAGVWPVPVMTSNSDIVALWSEDDGAGDRWQVGTWPLAGGSTRLDFAPGAGTAAAIAAGGGAAVVAYDGDASNDIHWRERPAGGAFGPLQTLDLTGSEIASNRLAVAMNAHGDVAFVWWGTAVYAAVKPAGGSFSAAVKLGDAAGFPTDFKAALSDSGELVAAWTDDTGVHAGRRSSGGQASPAQTLTGSSGTWVIDAFAMDGSGDALLVWREVDGATPTGKLALRGPGEDFAEATFPGPGMENRVPAAAAMSAAGLVTLAYHTKYGVAVYSGQFGTPLQRVHTFGSVSGNLSLAMSPGGRTVIAIDPDFYHRITAQRDGNGAFGPLEDLQSDCRNQWTPALAIDDAGRTVAGWGGGASTSSFLARGDAGPGHQGCAPAQTYSPDDAANPPPLRPDSPGSGIWGPVGSLPPVTLAHLTFGRPALSGSGATRSLKLDGTCGERCAAQGSVLVLRPNGRVIQKVWVWVDGGAEGRLAVRTKIALSPKTRAKLAGRPLEVELKLYLTDEWNRGVLRSFSARGAKVGVSAARVRRCARGRCRRRA
jgi:hypothetical protein